MIKFSLDIETACGVPECPNYGGFCDHGLDPYRNQITIIGLYWKENGEPQTATMRSAHELKAVLEGVGEYELTGANLKWDIHVLHVKGFTIPMDRWTDDVILASTCYTYHVTDEYMDWYRATRKQLNEQLPKGVKHRAAQPHSLKVMAPFYLGVEPFWETPGDHNNEKYVLQDCEYTYRLSEYFEAVLKEEGSWDFYKNKMLPWAKLLHRMERRGVKIDLDMLEISDAAAKLKAEEVKVELDKLWEAGYTAYRELKLDELRKDYTEKEQKAREKSLKSRDNKIEKAKTDKAKAKAEAEYQQRLLDIAEYYSGLYQNAAGAVPLAMNLGSPTQLTWLFKHYYKLDITDFDDEESTGKAVLQRLAGEGHKDVELFLEYRKQKKLTSSFFPTYRDLNVGGIIHASFHPFVARTGRLSSSDPNLQQVPGHLHSLFMARPGYKLITKDESAIEPRLLALVSDDLVLFDLLKTGQDFHGYNTTIFFELEDEVASIKKKFPKEREVGKEVALALMYGAGKFRLQESAQKRGFSWTIGECKHKVERFKEKYATIYQYREIVNSVLLDGPIQNIAGRWFRIPDPQKVFMTGLNTLIQGSASDLVLHSAYRAQCEFDRLGLDAHVILLVHDEIVVEAHESIVSQAEKILETCMTDYPLENSLGKIELKVEGKTADRWEK